MTIERTLLILLLALPSVACSDDDGSTSDDGPAGPSPAGDEGGNDDEEESGDEAGNNEEESGDEEGGGGGEEGGAVDNVAACEDLLAALECGTVDLTQTVNCDQYAALACDLVDYFGCLEDNFACTDGVFDPTGWTMCAQLATCS